MTHLDVTNAPLPLWARLGGALATPTTTLPALARSGGGGVIEPVLLLVLTAVLAEAAGLYRLGMLFSEAPRVTLRRMSDLVWPALRSDLLAAAVVVGVVALWAWRAGEKRGLTAAHAGTAAAYALVPLSALKLVGVVVAALGFDHWLLPHHAVDSLVVVVNRAVDPVRFASKLALNWLPPLVVLVAAIASTLRGQAEPTQRTSTAATRVGAVLLALLTAGATVATVVDVSARAERLRPVVRGDALPDVQLPRLNAPDAARGLGKKLRLSSLRGQVVVLDFWASWCTPCRRSIPELSALATELGPQGLVVLGINREGDLQSAQTAWAEIGARFESLVDVSDYGGRLGVSSLPTSYVVDRQGIVRHLHMGYVEPAVVRDELSQLLAEPAPATP